jgi:hypothetical protein
MEIKKLWVPHLRIVNPLEENAPTLILQNKFFFSHVDRGVVKINLIELKRTIEYSQSYRDNNSKHERTSSDI